MNSIYRQEVDSAGNVRYKIYVPLCLIFPMLQELPDEGCVYTGLGQKIKFNMRTVPANEWVTSTGSANDLSYRLQNVQLVRCFTKLDPIRSDLILKSSIQLPKLYYSQW